MYHRRRQPDMARHMGACAWRPEAVNVGAAPAQRRDDGVTGGEKGMGMGGNGAAANLEANPGPMRSARRRAPGWQHPGL